MREYDHKKIEEKWQEKWKTLNLYKTTEDTKKPKCYVLDEFPYPSGDGLHVGHTRIYSASDIYARMKRMQGFNVLHPSGWDAFGLPAEQYAIKNKVHPSLSVKMNTGRYKAQMTRVGLSYDWDREVNTTDPEFYKWTQWIFLQMYKRGLAFESFEPINWCPTCQTGLANEDLDGDVCERCRTKVEKKPMRQWVLRITKYADRLIDDLNTLDDWPLAIKEAQRNWIGRSEGAEIDFALDISGFSGDLVFASNNDGKLKRMQKLIKRAGLSITLKTPKDIGINDFSVIEDGATLEANSEKKARALGALTNLPILADDSGFYIKGTEIDPVTVKRNSLDGHDESEFTVDQVGEKMLKYYQSIAKKAGGKVDAEWHNALCFLTPDKVAVHIEVTRGVTLTDEPNGVMDPHLPLRPLYIPKATGKYALLQTEEEDLLELEPITQALKKLFSPSIKVFTTRPDTLFGATYLVLAPEHPWVTLAINPRHNVLTNKSEVARYAETAKAKTEIERQENKEKTGVKLGGVCAINPANGEKIPVYVSDYVLGNYGTGAIMAVPAHDERDFEFAKKFDIHTINVIEPDMVSVTDIKIIGEKYDITKAITEKTQRILGGGEVFIGAGKLRNSEQFNGLKSEDAKKAITEFVGGKIAKQYRLKDWVFSRQRYWGEPIPIIHCVNDGAVAVPEKDLPVTLPDVESYEPTGTGESPLAGIAEWVNTTCPTCGGPAKRETNTMPQWAGSSWYYLRFMDPKNPDALVSKEREKYWAPVDIYVGGAEHVTRHLIYARFWHKFLYDIGSVSTTEPFTRRRGVGLVLGEGGVKMSKRTGNVINPDDVVERFGADSLRVYEMFMGPFGQAIPWSTDNLVGARRFIERVHRLGEKFDMSVKEDKGTALVRNQTIKKVTEDIEGFAFNTAISQLMIFVNHLEKLEKIPEAVFRDLVTLVAPFAPHVADELWSELEMTESVYYATWPTFDGNKLLADDMTIAVQVNGKLRDTFTAPRGTPDEEIKKSALARPDVLKWLSGATPAKVIYVPGKIVNIVL